MKSTQISTQQKHTQMTLFKIPNSIVNIFIMLNSFKIMYIIAMNNIYLKKMNLQTQSRNSSSIRI